jgi:hypothetical protein
VRSAGFLDAARSSGVSMGCEGRWAIGGRPAAGRRVAPARCPHGPAVAQSIGGQCVQRCDPGSRQAASVTLAA